MQHFLKIMSMHKRNKQIPIFEIGRRKKEDKIEKKTVQIKQCFIGSGQ